MTTGFRNSAGVDFDDLFEPYTSGTKPAATGFRLSTGVDLRERYQPRGALQKISNVGFRTAGGVDLSSLWAAKGGVAYTIEGLDGRQFSAGESAFSSQASVSAVASVSLTNSGAWGATTANSQGPIAVPEPDNGTWHTYGGVPGDYDVLFTMSHSGSADRQATNSAAVWSSLATSRSVSLRLPTMSGVDGVTRIADATVRAQVRRRSTGQVVSDTAFALRAYTNGFA